MLAVTVYCFRNNEIRKSLYMFITDAPIPFFPQISLICDWTHRDGIQTACVCMYVRTYVCTYVCMYTCTCVLRQQIPTVSEYHSRLLQSIKQEKITSTIENSGQRHPNQTYPCRRARRCRGQRGSACGVLRPTWSIWNLLLRSREACPNWKTSAKWLTWALSKIFM